MTSALGKDPRGRSTVAIGLAILAFAIGWVATRQSGPVLRTVAAWRDARDFARALKREWPTLASSGARLDSGAGEVALVEFSDYQCPFCRLANYAVDSAITAVGLTVAYHHYPLKSIHSQAEGAARAAICAENQGHFREMHHYLMTTNTWYTDSNWVAAATAAQVEDLPKFSSCLADSATARRLTADIALGDALHLTGTPMFLSRDSLLAGVRSAAYFTAFSRNSSSSKGPGR